MPSIIVLGVVGVIIIFIIAVFNSLIAKKNQVHNVFSTIDVMLKKRYDLIPNLVAVVKGYMHHERELLEAVTKARTQAMSPNITNDQKVDIDNALTAMLGKIMVAVENYPQLKANDHFLRLQATMTELEEQISAARRAYNAAINDFNNAVEMFPTNIVASMMGYTRKHYFEIEEKDRQKPVAGDILNS